jgi:hypothetical protein
VKREAEEEWGKKKWDNGCRQKPDHDFRPEEDGTYVVEFRTVEGEVLAISIPRTETAVIRHFQERSRMGSSCRMFREEPLARLAVSAPLDIFL